MSGPNNCANLGISELNRQNSAKIVSFATSNPPKTLKQAIAQVVFPEVPQPFLCLCARFVAALLSFSG